MANLRLSVPPNPLKGLVTVTVTCSPAPASVALYLDGVSRWPTDFSSPFSFVFDTTQVVDGSHTLRADCLIKGSVQSTSVTVTVTNTVTPPTPSVTVSGAAVQGGTLTAAVLPNGSYTYQWRRCDTAGLNPVDIGGATSSTYLLVSADVGHTIRVFVSGGGNSITSAATSVVSSTASAISPTSFGSQAVGVYYSQTLSVSGLASPYTTVLSQGTLPAGMALTASSVANGDFESSTTGWFNFGTGQITRTTAQAKIGTASGQVTVSTVGDGAYTQVLGLANQTTYGVSCWVYGTSGRSYVLKLTGAGTGAIYGTTNFTGTGGWQQVSVSGAATTEGGFNVLFHVGGTGADTFYIDGVKLLTNYQGTPTTAGTYSFTVTAYDVSGVNVGHQDYSFTVAGASGGSGTTYEWITFDGAFPPANWVASTFMFQPGTTGASYAQVTDPLGVESGVLRLQCNYAPSLPTDYNAPGSPNSLQQAALSVSSNSQAHTRIGDDTWYRYRFMFPTANVFCNGYSNFLVEWHVNETGPFSPGLFAYGDYPLLAGGTTTPKLVFVMRSGNIAAPTEKFYPGATSTVETSSGVSIQTNHWFDCVFHIKWNTDPTLGLFEWWLDGVQKVSAVGATYYTVAGESLGNAIYNYRYNVTGNSNIYYGLIGIGTTASSVGFTP